MAATSSTKIYPKGRLQEPGVLRELARRTRAIASTLDEPEKSRMMTYAAELTAAAKVQRRTT